MRRRTAVALAALLVVLGGLVAFAVGVAPAGGDLGERWVSDTARENEVNHHAVGVGPEGDVVVAPVAEVPNAGVSITDDSCTLARLAPADGAVVWRTGIPADDCFTHALSQPAIEDVDGDGTLEVAVSTTEDALVAYDARTGDEEWRVPLTTYGYGRPTIADLVPETGPDTPEVVTSDIDGGLVVARGNGSTAWRYDLNETWSGPVVWAAPIVDDVDGDERAEVLVGSNRGPILLAADGTVEWSRNGSATYLAAAQADDDPALELFTAGSATVRAYDGATGETEWTRSLSAARLRAAADGDGDGDAELYLGRVGGDVLALDARTGETEWTTTVAGSDGVVVPPPVLGDVNGDGSPEVVAVTNAGTVAVLDATSGAELATYERNVRIWTFATPADVDDDGSAEVLVRYGDGRVVALEYSS